MSRFIGLRYRVVHLLVLGFIVVGVLFFNPLQNLELNLARKFFQWVGEKEWNAERVLLVDIDKRSFSVYGLNPPLSRKILALLLSRLRDAELIILTVPINGASGTDGDFALRRVLMQQRNIVLPVWFSELGASFGGIVTGKGVNWFPWRAILDFALVGGINLVRDGYGVVGFYPFFSYKAVVIPHIIMRALGWEKRIDEMRFSFSPVRRVLVWKDENMKKFSIPLSPAGYISLLPAVSSLYSVREKGIALYKVLPKDLVLRFLHKGIDIPPYELAKGKICFVGYSDVSPMNAAISIGAKLIPRHHLLAWGFNSLMNGWWLSYVPKVGVGIVFVLLLLWVVRVAFLYGVTSWWLVGLLVIGTFLIWVASLSQRWFFSFMWPLLGVVGGWAVSVWVKRKMEILFLERKGIEKNVVREIKTGTVSPFVDVPWVAVRVNTIEGEDVGGSMYDFLPFSGDRFGVVVADVMDKGKFALTKIAYVRGLLRSHFVITHQPGELVYSVNKALIKDKHLSITCKLLCVVFDTAKDRLLFSGAGGMSFIVLNGTGRQVKCFEVEERVPLGISREVFYEPKEVSLSPGDIIIFYSPAIFSVRNRSGKSYDIDRLARLVLVSAGSELGGIIRKVSRDISEFGVVKEDCTILGIEWKTKENSVEKSDDILVGISPGEKELLFYRRGKLS